MAPSTTKKKTTTGSTSMSSKVKVQVHRQTSNNPRPRAAPLPNDWPVASQPPQFSLEQSALPPGSLLQELCSGQDIHINKQALLAPSIAKEKGRYLLILPGTFSFKPLQQTSRAALTTTTTGGGSAADSQEEPLLPLLTPTQDSEEPKPLSPTAGNIHPDESDDDMEPNKMSSTATTTNNTNNNTNKPTLPQFGNLEGLTTPHPKLRISFPACQKSLVFPGSKIHTSSKYMWLNCAARKKGTVACKGIFSSAIVFGAPHWETEGNGDQPISEAAEHDPTTPTSSSPADEAPIHYGGSDRTIDGIWKGSKKKAPTNLPLAKVPILTKNTMGDQQVSGLLVKDIPTCKPSQSKTPKQPITLDNHNDNVDDDDDSSDDDDEYLNTTKVEVMKGRSTPKRRASTIKKKYTVDLLDCDVEDTSDNEGAPSESEGTTDNANATKPSNPPSRQAQKRKRASKDESDTSVDESNDRKATQKKTTRRQATKKSPKVVQPAKKKPSTTTQKSIRASSQRKQPQEESEESSSEKEILAISDEDEEDDNDEVVQRRLSTRTPRGSTTKPSYKEDDASDIEEKTESKSNDESEPQAISQRTARRGNEKEDPIELSEDSSSQVQTTRDSKRVRTSQRRSSAASKRYRDDPSEVESGSEEAEDDEDDEHDDDDDDDSEAPAPTKKPLAKKQRTTTTNRRSRTASSKTHNEKEESKPRGQTAKPNARKVPARRQSAAPRTNTNARQNRNNPTAAASLQSKRPENPRARANKKASDEPQDDTSQHSNAENDAVIINISDDSEVLPGKPLVKKGRRSVSLVSEVESTLPIQSPSPSALGSITSASSPFRSRRRKSTASKSTTQTTPAKRTVLDLSQDDEFNF